MRISSITYPDVNNGLGFRVTLWVQGCSHHCKGCQNKETWDFNGGREFSDNDKKIIFEALSKEYIKGITFSGGDPLDSFDEVYSLCNEIKKTFPNKDIWVYTGYTLEDIEKSRRKPLLDLVDILVDGEYNEALRDISLAFRGSSNQVIWKKEKDKFVKSELNNA